MITPFMVYVVLQMNSINGLLLFMALITAASTLLFLILRASWSPCSYTDEDRIAYEKWLRRSLISAAIAGIILGLSPSSKTLAAMLILPALTSEEVIKPVGKELKELYDLAKDGLRSIVEDHK